MLGSTDDPACGPGQGEMAMTTIPVPFPWYGGKALMVSWIVPLLPAHQAYVEVFGGSGAVLFAKPPSPMEVYNDVDQGCVTFFRVLRDPDLFPEFLRRAALMPYSRVEYETARAHWQDGTDLVEQALRWYIVARLSFSGDWGSSWGYDVTTGPHRRLAHHVSKWLSAVEGLPAFHARIQRCLIEGDDWAAILDRYDGPETLFYCDPPYVPDTRKPGSQDKYLHELTHADHEALVARLLTVQGMVILSGYDHAIYAPLTAQGWAQIRRDVPLRANNSRVSREGRRTECLWRNPAAQARQPQITLFDPS
jgi:DNA adenine methylase